MPLSEDVIIKLNTALGVAGLSHRVFISGGTGQMAEWVETDCLVWTVPTDPLEPWPQPSQDLQEALTRIGASIEQEHLEAMFHGRTKQLVHQARFNTLLTEEPPSIQADYETYLQSLRQYTPADEHEETRERQLLTRVRELIKDDSVFAYMINPDYSSSGVSAYHIVVAPTTDQFDALRIQRIEGTNYSLATEDTIAGLKLLDERFGIDIQGADGWVEFVFQRMPEGEEARLMSQWLREYCPNAYYEEYDEESESLRDSIIDMWWD